MCVFSTLTDRDSTIPSNMRGCESGTWSACWTGKYQRNVYKAPTKAKNKNKAKNDKKKGNTNNKNNKNKREGAEKKKPWHFHCLKLRQNRRTIRQSSDQKPDQSNLTRSKQTDQNIIDKQEKPPSILRDTTHTSMTGQRHIVK